MRIGALDWTFFFLFFALVVGVSLWKSRRSADAEVDYFLAGRSLPWGLIGISIVAANISTEQFVGMAGQGAGAVGLAVSWWQLVGTLGIVLIAFTLLPRFLQSGIYTMPEFLEYRYNALARGLFASFTVAVYVLVLITAVLFSGGLTLSALFGIGLGPAVWIVGAVAALYTAWGGLKAVAWADLLQGAGLLLGGLLVFFLGLHACGGWASFAEQNSERLHLVLPSSDPNLPWTGVAAGMWIVIIYYCGLNQFIVQRNLAAKTLRDGQLGVIFAGGLWLLVPFAIVMPGIMAFQLYPEALASNPDKAYPTLIARLLPDGLRGLFFATLSGAITSSLASMLNSASTIFSLDVCQRLVAKKLGRRSIIWIGRVSVLVFVTIGCLLAPMLSEPRFGGVFQYIQQFQGYIWPGVVAVFLFGILVDKTPPIAGVVGLLIGPIFYGALQFHATDLHFLIHVGIAFNLVLVVMALLTFWLPLKEPKTLPRRKEMVLETDPTVKLAAIGVLSLLAAFVIIFW